MLNINRINITSSNGLLFWIRDNYKQGDYIVIEFSNSDIMNLL